MDCRGKDGGEKRNEKNMGGRLLSEKINELKNKNNIRDELCHFDKLEDIINQYVDKDENHIDIKSWF